MKEYLAIYNSRQRKRHNVLPGLTGLAQVMGRNKIEWEKRLEYDILYTQNMGFLQDIKILIKTIVIVLLGTGVSGEGVATMKEFTKTTEEG